MCAHPDTHVPLAERHRQFPKKQLAPVTPGQVSLHHKAQQLKRVREAALVFGGRITNLCLQFTNPIIAMYLDHYSCVIKIWWLLLFGGNYHFLRFCNLLTLIGKTEFFQHEQRWTALHYLIRRRLRALYIDILTTAASFFIQVQTNKRGFVGGKGTKTIEHETRRPWRRSAGADLGWLGGSIQGSLRTISVFSYNPRLGGCHVSDPRDAETIK